MVRFYFNIFDSRLCITCASAIYNNNRAIRKSDGYTSHPWTRQEIPSLFNCVDPAWAIRKKKTIRPATAQPAMDLHHASVEDNVEVLVDLFKDGQSQDLSEVGKLFRSIQHCSSVGMLTLYRILLRFGRHFPVYVWRKFQDHARVNKSLDDYLFGARQSTYVSPTGLAVHVPDPGDIHPHRDSKLPGILPRKQVVSRSVRKLSYTG